MHTIDNFGLWSKISVVLSSMILIFSIIFSVVYSKYKSDTLSINKGYLESIDFSNHAEKELLSEILIRERITHYYKNHDYIIHFLNNNGKLYYSHHNDLIRCELCDKEKGITKHEL